MNQDSLLSAAYVVDRKLEGPATISDSLGHEIYGRIDEQDIP
jgi:hypothetical protein